MSRQIERAVVLGAGVMGAQIAALLACAGVRVRLLDLPLEGDATARAKRGIEAARKSRPPAFYTPEMAAGIEPGGLDDLDCVAQADWVIEAVVEEAAPKMALLAELEPYLHDELVISSNTSGLSIGDLAQGRSADFQRRFLGIHFFNPPRYMKLVEVIPGPQTATDIVDTMADYLRQALGKGVVRARDTPNFIGNRMWIFTACDMVRRMGADGMGVAAVDALTGPLMGRPKSATLRVCDIVGLDTVAHVAETSRVGLPHDPWCRWFELPDFYRRMLDENLLGAKVNAGFYRKGETGIEALDLTNFAYEQLQPVDLGPLQAALRERASHRRLRAVWEAEGEWADLGREHLLMVMAYAAEHAAEMAGDIVQIDQAMCWGFNWELGPFQLWDLFGVAEVVGALEAAGHQPPELATRLLAAGESHFYAANQAGPAVFSLAEDRRDTLAPVQSGLQLPAAERASWSNDSAYVVELSADIGALVFCGRMNALGPSALAAIDHVVAEAPFAGLVLCGAGDLFSVGADLKHMAALVDAEDWSGLDRFVADFQDAVMALRRAPFPVVAAVRGLALGGGCEFALGADARVAAAESRIGLVETRVGLIPGSGGCMELTRRHAGAVDKAFATIFAGQFSDNAFQARAWGLLAEDDEILIAEAGLLDCAVAKVRALVAGGYAGGEHSGVAVSGDPGLELLHRGIDERLAAGQISDHDALVGRGLARVLTGGGGAPRTETALALLDLERQVFLELCATAPTRARIDHMLQTGKPLQN